GLGILACAAPCSGYCQHFLSVRLTLANLDMTEYTSLYLPHLWGSLGSIAGLGGCWRNGGKVEERTLAWCPRNA
ncbi:hypothetical protein XENOCAPTIV_027642, partial [Xenoophorus captivus]